MAYSFQTFSVGQVLTASQMNAVEVNIRDHVHGSDGVVAAPVTGATQAEMEAGTSNTVAATPLNAQFHQSAAKCVMMATVAAGAPTLRTPPSYNITSIGDTATGRLTVTIATDFSSANWCTLASVEVAATTSAFFVVTIDNASRTAGAVLLECWEGDVAGAAMALSDPVSWNMAGYGDQ